MNDHTKYPDGFISDAPIGAEVTQEDGLGFQDYASTLAASIAASNGPLSIGVFGNWGSGKTSLMNMVRSNIERSQFGHGNTVIPVWFNAWRYEGELHPIVPLCATIIASLEARRNVLGKSVEALANALRAVVNGLILKAKILFPPIIEAEVGFDAKNVGIEEDPIQQYSLYYDTYENLDKAASQFHNNKVIVFVDDLDRCLPENAIKLLESIKLILNQPGFVFVFGLDRRTISSFVSSKYAAVVGVSGDVYLDKLFQVAFHIPDYSRLMSEYAAQVVERHLGKEQTQEFAPLYPAIGGFCRNNPRAVKRFLNNILIDKAIAAKRPEIAHIPLLSFGFARALQMHWPMVADAIRYDDGGICAKLSAEFEHLDGNYATLRSLSLDDTNENSHIYRAILQDRALQDLLSSEEARKWLSSEDRTTCWSLLQERVVEILPGEPNESGYRFLRPSSATIVDRHKIYTTVTRSGWCKAKLKEVFHDLSPEIIEKADEEYWKKVKWSYPTDSSGNILGKVTHSNGSHMYVMEFNHNNGKVYLFVSESGVQVRH